MFIAPCLPHGCCVQADAANSSLEVYLAIALVYLVLTSAASYLLHRLERNIRAGGMVQ
jgi:ABC-type amino acid transport system permease subunit